MLGLTFGGGLATGLVLSGIHRGGLFVSQVGPGQQWQDGERQWGGEPRQGPDRGTPPQHRDGPDEGDDDTATPTPTPNS
ncbi:hypothetical protein SAMN04487846_3071 [Microbacterium sp. cf046]|nr:hypothetical protein SAMN04487846_3071 [Microbacterium sp. cf046]